MAAAVAFPNQPATLRDPGIPRRRRTRAHNVLGDVQEFEAALREVERPPTPPPKEETFDIDSVPRDVRQAMDLCSDTYQAVLDSYKALHAERASLLQQHNTILELRRRGAASCLTITDQLASTREQRILTAHEAREARWAAQAVDLSDRLGKHASDLTLTRIFKHRARQEKLNHILKSIPVSERVAGPDLWKITLRDSYARFVPIGNIFSGLFVECVEKPPEQQNVALEIFGKPDAFDPSKSDVAMRLSIKRGLNTRRLLKTQEEKGRAWMQGAYLQSVERKHKKHMDKLMAHYPDTSKLAIVGASMTEKLLQMGQADIPLDEVLQRLRATNSAAYERFKQAANQRDEERRLAAEQARADAAAALAAAAAARGPVGPALAFTCTRLHLQCAMGESARAALHVTNTGTAAVYFSWTCFVPPFPFPSVNQSQKSSFYMPAQSGTILPGEEKEFWFTFKPQRAGAFTERWNMHTNPALVGAAPPEITLRGCAFIEDARQLHRRSVAALLRAEQRGRRVAAAVESILRSVDAPPPPQLPLPGAERRAHDAFAGGTAGLEPPVFYNADAVAALEALFQQLRECVAAAEASTPKKKKGPAKGEVEEPPFPSAWDGRVDSLQDHIAQVRTLNASSAQVADEVEAKLSEVLRSCSLPRQLTVLHSHTLREILLAAVSGAEAAAEQAMAAAVEEESLRRQEAIARGEAVEEPVVPPPPEPVKGKGKKDAAAPPPPPPPAFNKEDYDRYLFAAVRDAVSRELGTLEDRLHRRQTHLGALLDADIANVQAQLQRSANEEGAQQEACTLAWQTFALLRKRQALGVPQPPAPLVVVAKAVRQQE